MGLVLISILISAFFKRLDINEEEEAEMSSRKTTCAKVEIICIKIWKGRFLRLGIQVTCSAPSLPKHIKGEKWTGWYLLTFNSEDC